MCRACHFAFPPGPDKTRMEDPVAAYAPRKAVWRPEPLWPLTLVETRKPIREMSFDLLKIKSV